MKFQKSRRELDITTGFCFSGTTASITLKDVRLTVANGGAQTEVSNINTRMQNFSEHSSAGVKVW